MIKDVDKIYIGSEPISKVYLGNDLIWAYKKELPKMSVYISDLLLGSKSITITTYEDRKPLGDVKVTVKVNDIVVAENLYTQSDGNCTVNLENALAEWDDVTVITEKAGYATATYTVYVY